LPASVDSIVWAMLASIPQSGSMAVLQVTHGPDAGQANGACDHDPVALEYCSTAGTATAPGDGAEPAKMASTLPPAP
jgi:hypothetical protein